MTKSQATPAAYVMDLTRSIEAHGDTLNELRITDPGIGAFEGLYISANQDGVKIDLGSLPRLIAEGAGIPLSSAKKISVADFLRHAEAILGFFGTDTPPTGGN